METTLTSWTINSLTEVCNKADRCELVERILSENMKLVELLRIGTIELERKNNEIDSLSKENKYLIEILGNKEKHIKLLQTELSHERTKSRLYAKMLFGNRSDNEKQSKCFEDEQENIEFKDENYTSGKYRVRKTRRGAVKGHKGHGRKMFNNLETKEVVIDLPEDKKRCGYCGKPFKEIELENVSEEITFEKKYYRKIIRRKSYKKACNCESGVCIIRPEVPPKLIKKGKFSIEFWVQRLIDKYLKHLPITRQIFEMSTYGVDVSSGTIAKGFKTINTNFIQPLYDALIVELRKARHIHIDESGWHVFLVIQGKKNYNWFVWVYVTDKLVVYVIDSSRGARVPYKIVFNIESEDIKNIPKDNIVAIKTINTDKFVSYKSLQNKGLVRIGYCWTHQRQEFIDLDTKYSDDNEIADWVNEWITKIDELYIINNERIKYQQGTSEFIKYDRELRKIIDLMKLELKREYHHPGQTEVIKSMRNHWEGLTLFVDNPEIPMDNNVAERMLRHAVVGRKNYYGNHSIWAGKLSAAMFSIIHTCLMNNISPEIYLKYYFEECAKRSKAPLQEEILAKFLPWNLPDEIKLKATIPKKRKPDILNDS